MESFYTTASKRVIAILLLVVFLISTFTPLFQTPFSPKPVYAACTSSSGSQSSAKPTSQNNSPRYSARVGGVALDQAAKFLADMTEVTGAYYDATLDRVVFVGKTQTVAPAFDKDDLAVAIRAVIFNNAIPAVSMEDDPADPDGPNLKVLYYGGIENTRFGKVLFDADNKMKSYIHGYEENGQMLTSSVAGYKSFFDRYIEKNPDVNAQYASSSRWWITPKLITLKKDDTSKSFVFDQSIMQVKTEPLSANNDPKWNQAAEEFAQQHTELYDQFAQETQSYADAKQLGRIVAVIKWLKDNRISTDFHFARDYTPLKVATPVSVPKRSTPWRDVTNGRISLVGGADFITPNTYTTDTNGAASSLKNASQAVGTTKEDIQWSFTNNGTQYQSVAVTADAFRSIGSYNTSATDLTFPTAGDLSLSFTRSYSSYSGGQYGVGRGWNIFPASLYDNDPIRNFTCSAGILPKGLAFSSSMAFESFTINDCAIGYVADDPAYHSKILRNANGSYTVTRKDQTQFNFNNVMQLVSVKDKNGNTISYNYDGSGRLVNIADSKNHTLALTYNADGLITSIADWSGRKVSYTYDAPGNLLTVTDPNGNVTAYTYDSNYKLVSVTDRTNTVVQINTYTDEAKLATQKDATERTNTYSYDTMQRSITVSDTNGRIQKTTYDTKARILEQKDPILNSTKYTYGVEFNPLTITDRNGNTVTNTYDAQGNVLTVTYPDTKKVTYTYDSKNRVIKISDARYGATPKDTSYSYDGNGNLTQITESGRTSTFSYDTSGELLTATDPLLHKVSWTRDVFGNKLTEKDALNNTMVYEYDSIARLVKETDANGKTVSYTHDKNGNILSMSTAVGVTTNTYDKENRLVKVTLPDNTITEYAYNPSGSLTTVTDALEQVTSYGYDLYQNLITQQDALSKSTTFLYDPINRLKETATELGAASKWEYDANGNITKRIDANNQTTLYTYDAFNRLTKITYPDTKTIIYSYDNRGNRVQMIDSIGTTTYVYDIFDRLTKVTNPYGKIISYTYDNANNLTKIIYPESKTVTYTYDASNKLTTVTDWNGEKTIYSYNNNGTIATRTMPNGIKSLYTYDSANRLQEISHTQETTTLAKFAYERDSVGNITKSVEQGTFFPLTVPSPTATPTPTPTSLPTPTPNGTEPDLRITGIATTPVSPTSGSRFTITLSVTNQGNSAVVDKLVKVGFYYNLPQLPTYQTNYNDFDLISVTLAAGETKEFSYPYASFYREGPQTIHALIDQGQTIVETDETNNASSAHTLTVLAAPSPTVTLTPTPTSVLASPTPTRTPTPTSSVTNKADLITTSLSLIPSTVRVNEDVDISVIIKNQGTLSTGGNSVRVGFYYDRATAPTLSTSVDDSEYYFTTINPGQSVTVTETNVEFETTGSHNIWILVDQTNAVSESNESNNVYGPYNINVVALENTTNIFASNPLLHFVNQMLSGFKPQSAYAQVVMPELVTTFNYDALSRLKNASYWDNSQYAYTYDAIGNRLSETTDGTTKTYTYDNDHKLVQGGNLSYYYDTNGNQTMRTQTAQLDNVEFVYDYENKLIKHVAENGNTTAYRYDGAGNRLQRNFEGAIKRYVVDTSGPLSRVIAETGGTNYATNFYLYGVGLISQGSASRLFREYYLEDGLGNARFITDEDGEKVHETTYDPFGNARVFEGNADRTTFQFSTEQLDEETDLYYLRARYYDPVTGRFISRDPIKGSLTNPQSQNPYAYALNNPVVNADPSGEWVDSAIDVAFIINDLCQGNYGWAAVDTALLLLPIANAAIVRGGAQALNHAKRMDNLHETAKIGREMHRTYKADDVLDGVRVKEFSQIKGIRPDFVDFDQRTIYELKPNNPQAIKRGEKQLENYSSQFEQIYGGKWNTVLDTYNR